MGKTCKSADFYARKNDHSSLAGKMASGKFRLKAKVSSDNLPAVKQTLERVIGDKWTIRKTDHAFEVEA